MRRTITISVSSEMHDLIYEGMRGHYYGTVSEYLRFLVRRDQRPDAVKEPEVKYDPPKRANEYFEDALREIEELRTAFGDQWEEVALGKTKTNYGSD